MNVPRPPPRTEEDQLVSGVECSFEKPGGTFLEGSFEYDVTSWEGLRISLWGRATYLHIRNHVSEDFALAGIAIIRRNGIIRRIDPMAGADTGAEIGTLTRSTFGGGISAGIEF